jgi:hypothetical protein
VLKSRTAVQLCQGWIMAASTGSCCGGWQRRCCKSWMCSRSSICDGVAEGSPAVSLMDHGRQLSSCHYHEAALQCRTLVAG